MFNWIKSLFSKREFGAVGSLPISSIESQTIARLWGLSAGTGDEVAVNEDSILALGTLWRAARVISESVGNLPLKIYTKDQEGNREEANTHWAKKLLTRRPGPRLSRQDFFTLLVWHALLFGQGAARIVRDGATAKELVPICPYSLRFNPSNQEYYIQTQDGNQEHIPYEDLLIILGPSPDGSLGYRLCQTARSAFAFAISTERYGSAYFRNSCDVGGWLTAPPGMSEQAKENIVKSLERRAKGVDRSGAIAFLEDGCSFQDRPRNHEQGQYHETRMRNALEVCKFLGVDPVLCFEYDRATWANSTEGKQNFLDFTLNTWLNKIENEVNEKIILPSEQDTTYVEFNRQALTEMNQEQQAAVWALGIQNGWLDPNTDVRRFLGLKPLPKPEPAPAPAPAPGATPAPVPAPGDNKNVQ